MIKDVLLKDETELLEIFYEIIRILYGFTGSLGLFTGNSFSYVRDAFDRQKTKLYLEL